MDKRIKHVIPDTQQEITTTVELEGDEMEVEIRACSALDDELRSDFHEMVRGRDSEQVSVRSRTARSNQGNEVGQDVTITFALDHQPRALNVIDEIIEIGQEYYELQLERELAREKSEGDSDWKQATQQKYFGSDALQEFCLLYRGQLGI